MVKRHCKRRHVKDQDKPNKFGDQVTGDHLISKAENSRGFDGATAAMVLYDLGTKWTQCEPTCERNASSAEEALRDFVGPVDPVASMRIDNARELKKAAVKAGLCSDKSTPYVSQTNGVVERRVRHVEEGTRTILE